MSDLQARELAEPDITPAHRDSYDINIYIVVWQTVFVTKPPPSASSGQAGLRDLTPPNPCLPTGRLEKKEINPPQPSL